MQSEVAPMQNLEHQHQVTVMVIDDNPIDHFLAAAVVRQINPAIETICFSSVDDAMELLQRRENGYLSPLIILLDINMPGKTGFDFLDSFAGLSGRLQEQCSIIMLSSSVAGTDIERAQASPFVRHYLSKPLTAEHLRNVMEKITSSEGTAKKNRQP